MVGCGKGNAFVTNIVILYTMIFRIKYSFAMFVENILGLIITPLDNVNLLRKLFFWKVFKKKNKQT